MKIAIMQPYFFPYIGYFQLINAVDEFVLYDNIEYTKKGWINRNRILVNGNEAMITLPIKKDSDYLNINNRFLAETWAVEQKKMLNRIYESYRKAPYFIECFDVIEKCINFEDRNLFNFVFNSIQLVMKYLNIDTKLIVSSSVPIDHQLKSVEKVMALCMERGANVYINPIGGLELYDKESFKKNKLELQFLRSNNITYTQYTNEYIPWMSMIDVMMFNSKDEITSKLGSYNLY
jgi:hypothetical protein